MNGRMGICGESRSAWRRLELKRQLDRARTANLVKRAETFIRAPMPILDAPAQGGQRGDYQRIVSGGSFRLDRCRSRTLVRPPLRFVNCGEVRARRIHSVYAPVMSSLSPGRPEDTERPAKPSHAFLFKIELHSHPQLLCVIRGAMEPLMEVLGFSAESGREIIRAVDESVSNIMRHSYHGRMDLPIELHCSRLERCNGAETEQGIEILIFDSGPTVDPTKLEARPLEEIRPGGLGLHIIRASMDSVEYKRDGQLNQLRLVKFTGSKKCCPELKDQGQ